MSTKQVLDAIRAAIGRHVGSEKELLEELDAEAEGWRMRLDELEAEEAEDKE